MGLEGCQQIFGVFLLCFSDLSGWEQDTFVSREGPEVTEEERRGPKGANTQETSRI